MADEEIRFDGSTEHCAFVGHVGGGVRPELRVYCCQRCGSLVMLATIHEERCPVVLTEALMAELRSNAD